MGIDDLHADADDRPFTICRQRLQELRVFDDDGLYVETQDILVTETQK